MSTTTEYREFLRAKSQIGRVTRQPTLEFGEPGEWDDTEDANEAA